MQVMSSEIEANRFAVETSGWIETWSGSASRVGEVEAELPSFFLLEDFFFVIQDLEVN